MKRMFLFPCAFLVAVTAFSQPKIGLLPDETVLLYADGLEETSDPVIAGKIVSAGFEMAEGNGESGPEKVGKVGDIRNISTGARVDLYFPDNPNGQMVVVCPGGGYAFVGTYNEGVYVADWMLSRGITVAVVKHRMPNCHWEVPLADAQNAFRYCRRHAAEWRVNQIGVMGFSAGGHLAACVSTLYVDDVTRPDFSILVYPVITMEEGVTDPGTNYRLLGKKEVWESDMEQYNSLMDRFSLEKQVTSGTPPAFLVHCGDDRTVPVENTLRYYRKLVENNVPAEVLIFPVGGHGWGYRSEKIMGRGNDRFPYGREIYDTALEHWLESLRLSVSEP